MVEWSLRDIRVIIVHYRTVDLLEDAVRSFRHFYPSVSLTIVDNGSTEETRAAIETLASDASEATDVMTWEENLGHGPGMHRAIGDANEPLLFLLDSDTVVTEGGFMELMLGEVSRAQGSDVLGIGRVIRMNRRGFFVEDDSSEGSFPALDAAYMMIVRSHYESLPGFEHHGAPVAGTFREADARGLSLLSFPIERYIDHLHRGTVQRHGYGLGLRSKIDYILNKLGL